MRACMHACVRDILYFENNLGYTDREFENNLGYTDRESHL